MTAIRRSYEDWWNIRGRYLFDSGTKEALWVVFSDGWGRALKERET